MRPLCNLRNRSLLVALEVILWFSLFPPLSLPYGLASLEFYSWHFLAFHCSLAVYSYSSVRLLNRGVFVYLFIFISHERPSVVLQCVFSSAVVLGFDDEGVWSWSFRSLRRPQSLYRVTRWRRVSDGFAVTHRLPASVLCVLRGLSPRVRCAFPGQKALELYPQLDACP